MHGVMEPLCGGSQVGDYDVEQCDVEQDELSVVALSQLPPSSPPSPVRPHVGTGDILTESGVRALDYGYGSDGASVQLHLHVAGWVDRTVMEHMCWRACPSLRFNVPCERTKR